MQGIKSMMRKAKRKVRRGWNRVRDWKENRAQDRRGKEETASSYAGLRDDTAQETRQEKLRSGQTRYFHAGASAGHRDAPRSYQTASHVPEEPEPLLQERKHPRSFVLSVLFTTVKILAVGAVVLVCGVLGLGVGVAKAYIDTTPTLDAAQLTKSDRTSYLYDMNGDLITSIADLEYREWASFDEIPDMLVNAFIAVEDVRFYKHSGVDIKRLLSAVLEVFGNRNGSGGSTLTQQLVKNKITGSERTYKRKIQEAYLAVELEQMMEKNNILEAYLNDIYLGESNYGVKTAAQDYFGKEMDELTIRECAMLAGLPQSPYSYNPRKNMYQRDKFEVTNNRTDTVLKRMYTAGFITKEQYESALQEELHILPTSEQKQMYEMPHFVEYAIRDVVTHLLAQRGMADTSANRSQVENELRTGGYHIYTTVDPRVQQTVQDTLMSFDGYPSLADPNNSVKVETGADGSVIETKEPQAAAVVADQSTGELRAIVGARETPTIRKSFNRAYQSYMEVGSSIKPLAIYGPALDLGVSPATIIANMRGPIPGYGGTPGYPNGGLEEKYYGPITVRRGIVSSLNVVAARTLYEYVGTDVAANYLLKLGATESKINADGPGLALGTSGFTPIQMAAAYCTIASGGEYKELLSFTKVVDNEGNVILDAEEVRERHPVYDPASCYLLIDILTQAVQSGTGTKAKIPGMTVAGKTGTNSDYCSVYFAGMTPYYTGVVWIGHDDRSKLLKSGASGGTYAAPLWQAFMKPLHEEKTDKKIMSASTSELGLVKCTVCSVSGKLATEACEQDTCGHVPVTDWFKKENVPTEYCDVHAVVSVCTASGGMASSACPPDSVTAGAVVLVNPGSYYDQFTDEELLLGIPNAVRTEQTLEEFNIQHSAAVCPIHSSYGGIWGGMGMQEQTPVDMTVLRTNAAMLLQQVQQWRTTVSLREDQAHVLQIYSDLLSERLGGTDAQALQQAYTQLKNYFEQLSSGNG